VEVIAKSSIIAVCSSAVNEGLAIDFRRMEILIAFSPLTSHGAVLLVDKSDDEMIWLPDGDEVSDREKHRFRPRI